MIYARISTDSFQNQKLGDYFQILYNTVNPYSIACSMPEEEILPGSQATNDPKNHRRNAKAEYATRARF
jgi:hypothetical protein